MLLAIALLFAYLAVTTPLGRALEPLPAPAMLLVSADGQPIARRGAMKLAPVEVADLPKHVPLAFVSIEDRRFYGHLGIDPRAIARAAWVNLRAGGVREVRVGPRSDARVTEIVRLAEVKGVPVRRVDAAELDRLSDGERHQGVLATLGDAPRRWTLEQLVQHEAKPLIVVLDGVEDPHNVGAILRSAAAFGVAAMVLQDRHAPPETGSLARAASGALEVVPVVREVNLARALRELKDAGLWVVGLDAAAPVTLAQVAHGLGGRRVALVLGAEGEGLRRLTRETCDEIARLPIAAEVESLNVSAAAAVALYELARR